MQSQTRDIDLVISEDRMMAKLLHFLVLTLRTVDGAKNTANPYLYVMAA